MDHYREKTSTFFTGLTSGLGRKLRSTIFSRSPPPQTSLIFELPNELILSIPSHVSPDSQLGAGHRSRLYVLHDAGNEGYHDQRAEFLRPLSAICKEMRLRLLPWVWERVEVHQKPRGTSEKQVMRGLNVIAECLAADTFLAASVKFIKIHPPEHGPITSLLIKCLRSLPNLHTLEIEWTGGSITTALRSALTNVEFPNIRTLIIPLTAHPLLRHCPGVEDIVYVPSWGWRSTRHEVDFVESLASIPDSKVKRLVVPLSSAWPASPPNIVTACPGLAELTIIFPYHPGCDRVAETEIKRNLADIIPKLAASCEPLPDFSTLQIVRLPVDRDLWIRYYGSYIFDVRMRITEPLEHSAREEAKDTEDWVIDCLKMQKTGCRGRGGEGEGRKRITLKIVAFPRDPRSVEGETVMCTMVR